MGPWAALTAASQVTAGMAATALLLAVAGGVAGGRRRRSASRRAPPAIADAPPRRHGADGGAARLVDVSALVAEALDGAPLPSSIAVLRPDARHVALVEADPRVLREALRGLIRAAGEAMPAGGELGVAISRQPGQLVVVVADSGAPLARSATLDGARELLARCGGRLARASVPGRGNRSRAILAAPVPPPLRVRRTRLF